MRRHLCDFGTFLILIVFFHFSGCSLSYFIFLSFSVVYSIVEILYCSYSSVCPVGDNRKSYLLSYLANLTSTLLGEDSEGTRITEEPRDERVR